MNAAGTASDLAEGRVIALGGTRWALGARCGHGGTAVVYFATADAPVRCQDGARVTDAVVKLMRLPAELSKTRERLLRVYYREHVLERVAEHPGFPELLGAGFVRLSSAEGPAGGTREGHDAMTLASNGPSGANVPADGAPRGTGTPADDGAAEYAALALRFVEGPTLGEWLTRSATTTVVERWALGLAITELIGDLHAEAIVHRDIKPENLVLSPVPRASELPARCHGAPASTPAVVVGDCAWRPVLVDFGLARDLAVVGPHFTSEASLLGTPTYMAPEQWLAPRAVTLAADVYALALVWIEVLTGRRLHEPPRIPARAAELGSVPPYRTAPELRALLPSALPSEIAAILAQALSPEPAERPPDARVLATALRACGARNGPLGPSDGGGAARAGSLADSTNAHAAHAAAEPRRAPIMTPDVATPGWEDALSGERASESESTCAEPAATLWDDIAAYQRLAREAAEAADSAEASAAHEQCERQAIGILYRYFPLFVRLARYERQRAHYRLDPAVADEDYVWAFFEYCVAQRILERADPERGRLRNFLRGVMRRHWPRFWQRAARLPQSRAQPRGLSSTSGFDLDAAIPSAEATPDEAFEFAYNVGCVESALEALAGELCRDDRRLFAGRCLSDDPAAYAELLETLDERLSVNAVYQRVCRMRRDFLAALAQAAAADGVPPEDREVEVRALLGVLAQVLHRTDLRERFLDGFT